MEAEAGWMCNRQKEFEFSQTLAIMRFLQWPVSERCDVSNSGRVHLPEALWTKIPVHFRDGPILHVYWKYDTRQNGDRANSYVE